MKHPHCINLQTELLTLTKEFLLWCDANPIAEETLMNYRENRPPDLLQFAWWLEHVKNSQGGQT